MSMTKQKLEQLIDQYDVKVRRFAEQRGDLEKLIRIFGYQAIAWTEQQNIDVLTALKMLRAKWEKVDE